MNLVLKTSSLSALLLVAAAFTMPSGSVAAKDIVLGASVQLTGPVANTGRYYRDAYQLAIDKINAAGGVKVGNESHKLALKLYDNQSDVNLSVRQYTQLVSQDKVGFLLGPFASNFALADSAVSEKYKIPMVQGGGASDQIFSRKFNYIFGTLAPASNYFGSTVEMLKGLDPAPKSVALLYADDAFDVSVAEGTRPKLKQAGLTLAMDERYSTNATDFNSLLSQIRSKNIDAVLVAGHETEILNFVRQAKSLAVAPKMYSFTVGVPSEDFRKALGKDADYAFGMTAWLPSADLKDRWFGDAAQFAAAYKAKFGYDPDYHAASGVADVEALVQAVETAGSIDPERVRDALSKVKFDRPVWSDCLQRERPDRSAPDSCPGPERRLGRDLRRQRQDRAAEISDAGLERALSRSRTSRRLKRGRCGPACASFDQRNPLGRFVRRNGARSRPGLGCAQYCESCAWRIHHARRLRVLVSLHLCWYRPVPGAADYRCRDVCHGLRRAARPFESDRQGPHVQHVADNLWARGRTHLPRPACVFSRLSHHQPGLRRQQYHVGAGGAAGGAASGVRNCHCADDWHVAVPAAHTARTCDPRHRAKPCGRPALRR